RDLPEFRLTDRVWEANKRAGAPKTQFVDIYGCAEVGPAATECECNDGFHLIQGHIYTEVIDEKTRRHVNNGERGLVVHTGLRHGSRYVRYVVGDEATFVTDPCQCGRTSPRIKDVVRVMEKDRLMQGCAGSWDIDQKSKKYVSAVDLGGKIDSEARMASLENKIQTFVAKLLEHRDIQSIDWDQSFEEIGLDSLGMMDIANFINDQLGITFAPMLMFSYGHCATLVAYLNSELLRQFADYE
ncbi:MAG: phosphopantetheine-binding protein, partial [Pseudomonadota bacterium]